MSALLTYGGIRHNEIEGAFDSVRPLAGADRRPRAKTACLDILSGDLGGGRRRIDPDTMRVATFREQRAEERPRADAEIENAQRVARPGPERGKRRLDQRLRLRARVEHVGRHLEIEAPEFACARDPRQRFAPEAPLRDLTDPHRGRFAEGRLGRGDQARLRETSRLA